MIKKVTNQDLKPALDLVNKVFSEFVVRDYSQQGQSTFESYLKSKLQEVTADLNSGSKKIWAYYQSDEIIGVIATQNTSHITLMFVDKKHHRKGIARQLLGIVLEELKTKNISQVTVNSSPYAVKVYEQLSFVKTAAQQENDGIIFIPMMRQL
jgi:predicted acetyltransferase